MILIGSAVFIAGLIHNLPSSRPDVPRGDAGDPAAAALDSTTYGERPDDRVQPPPGTAGSRRAERVAPDEPGRYSGRMAGAAPSSPAGTGHGEAAAGASGWAPWLEEDDDAVAGEIAAYEARHGTDRVAMPVGRPGAEQLADLIPGLAESLTGEEREALTLSDVTGVEGAAPLPPGAAPRPGPYFEPE